jgi:hypothetical protein
VEDAIAYNKRYGPSRENLVEYLLKGAIALKLSAGTATKSIRDIHRSKQYDDSVLGNYRLLESGISNYKKPQPMGIENHPYYNCPSGKHSD